MTLATRNFPKTRPPRARGRGAYSLVEALVVVSVLAVLTSLVICPLSSVNDSTRLDAAVKRSTALIRYARMLAMSSGQQCTVEFNATTQVINVYLGSATTPVSNSLFNGGACSLNLHTDPGVAGVCITGVTNAGTPARITYGVLGTRVNPPSYASSAVVSFACGAGAASLTIPNVGDPQ
jgi:Tfp pilus assembly protein FimT